MSESQPSARQMLESNFDLIRDLIRHGRFTLLCGWLGGL
jgi:hypothetical protein